jgi:hypothetical protein
VALAVGVIAAILCVVCAFLWPVALYSAYLVAYWFWLSIALGCLGTAMIHHLTGGAWGIGIRRLLEAIYSTLPLLAILFLPIWFGMRTLFVWSIPDVIATDELLQKKTWWLNVMWFELRAVVYFVLWIGLAWWLNWLSSGTDPRDEALRQRRLALLSGPGLVVWFLTLTFASVDWAMSIDPHWFSSMFGVIFIGGSAVAGLAAAIIGIIVLWPYRPWGAIVTVSRVHDLGNLLLAYVMFWAYVSFSQFLLIWSGNLPEETTWYLDRNQGGWQVLVVGLIVLHFFVPFLLLLIRQTKRHPERLLAVCGLLLFMRFIDLYWTIVPTYSRGRFWANPMVLLTLPAIGGLCLAMFAWRLPARAALPVFELPPDETGENEHELAHQPTA